METYKDSITYLPDNGIYVFGCNPVGINGNPIKGTGGAALFALKNGWVEQGEKIDNKLSKSGKAWGLTTVTYPAKKRSKTQVEIKAGISILYDYAKLIAPEKKFYVAYTCTGRNLNGYSTEEMAEMFGCLVIPENVVFEEEFSKLIFK